MGRASNLGDEEENNMSLQSLCCDKCLNSKFALKGKLKQKFGGICGLVCECHKSSQESVKPMQNPIHSLISEAAREYAAGDPRIELALKDDLSKLVKQVLEEIIKAAPERKKLVGDDCSCHISPLSPPCSSCLALSMEELNEREAFNAGRAQTLQVITEYLGKEEI